MTKKALIIVSLLFSLLFISNASFATNNPAGTATNAIHNTAAGAINGTNNMIHNTAGTIENATHNASESLNTTTTKEPKTTNKVATTNYSTVRTDTNVPATRTTANMIVWVSLAIAAVVIVGLIWYYASQEVRRDR